MFFIAKAFVIFEYRPCIDKWLVELNLSSSSSREPGTEEVRGKVRRRTVCCPKIGKVEQLLAKVGVWGGSGFRALPGPNISQGIPQKVEFDYNSDVWLHPMPCARAFGISRPPHPSRLGGHTTNPKAGSTCPIMYWVNKLIGWLLNHLNKLID